MKDCFSSRPGVSAGVFMMGNVRKCQIYLIKSKTLIWLWLWMFSAFSHSVNYCVLSNFQINHTASCCRGIVNTESLLSIDLLISLDQIHFFLFRGRIIPQAESPR